MPYNPNKPKELRYISRVEIPAKPPKGKTYGWQIRFIREDIKVSRFFSDTKYGGREESLIEAKAFRDEVEQLYPQADEKAKYLTKRGQRNKSGIVGVHRIDHFYTKKDRKGSYLASAWGAQWLDKDGKRKGKRFSIPKYGETKALKLAIMARHQAIEQLSGNARPPTEWGDRPYEGLVALIETSTIAYEKGKALEELLTRLFADSSSFSVNSINTLTETEEIDITVLNKSEDPRFRRESAILLVECKNWSKKCGKNEFVLFKEKIENRKSRCSLGFFISWNGFADTFPKEMLRGSREQPLIIPLTGEDIRIAINANNFESALAKAWDKAISI